MRPCYNYLKSANTLKFLLLICFINFHFTVNAQRVLGYDFASGGDGISVKDSCVVPPATPGKMECVAGAGTCEQPCECTADGVSTAVAGFPVDFSMSNGIPNDYVYWTVTDLSTGDAVASGDGSSILQFVFPITGVVGAAKQYSVCFYAGKIPTITCPEPSFVSCCKIVSVSECTMSPNPISVDLSSPVPASPIKAGVPFVMNGTASSTNSSSVLKSVWSISSSTGALIDQGEGLTIASAISLPKSYTVKLTVYDEVTGCAKTVTKSIVIIANCADAPTCGSIVPSSLAPSVGTPLTFSVTTPAINSNYVVNYTITPADGANPFFGNLTVPSSTSGTSSTYTTPSITFTEPKQYRIDFTIINGSIECSVVCSSEFTVYPVGCTSSIPDPIEIIGLSQINSSTGGPYTYTMIGGTPNSGVVTVTVAPVAPNTSTATYLPTLNASNSVDITFNGVGLYLITFRACYPGSSTCCVEGTKEVLVVDCSKSMPSEIKVDGPTTGSTGVAIGTPFTMTGGVPNTGNTIWYVLPNVGVSPIASGFGTTTPNFIFSFEGTYTVYFETYNTFPACKVIGSKVITISNTCTGTSPSPITITPSTSNITTGTAVTFTPSGGTPNTSGLNWTIVPNTGVVPSSGTGTANVVFTQTGVYTITYTAYNIDLACNETTSYTFVVSPSECTRNEMTDCNITGTTAGVVGSSYTFTMTGGIPNNGVVWEVLPTAGISHTNGTGTSASIKFGQAGTYTIVFTAYYNGCVKTCSHIITISPECTNPLPSAMTIGGPTSVTTGTNVTYSITSGGTPSTSTTWAVTPSTGVSASSGTGTSATVNFTTAGTYVLTFTAINGTVACMTTANIIITVTSGSGCVQPSAMTLSGPTTANTGTSVTYSITSGGTPNTGITWAISPSTGVSPSSGTGTSATVTYSTSGNYTITFTAINGVSTCNTTASLATNVTCTSQPSACSVAGNDNGVTGTQYTFTLSGGTPNTSVTWQVTPSSGASPTSGSGTTANVTFSTAGTYNVVFTAWNGSCFSTCSKTIVITQNVCPFCTVYGPSNGVVGGTYNFNSSLSSGSNTPTWSVTPSSGVSPSSGSGNNTNITFNSAGTYTVTFSYTVGSCGLITCEKTIVIGNDCNDNQPQIYGPSNVLVGSTETYYIDNIYVASYPTATWYIVNSSGSVVQSGSGTSPTYSVNFGSLPAGDYTIHFSLRSTSGTCYVERTKNVTLFSSCPSCSVSGPTTGSPSTLYYFTSSNPWNATPTWTVSPATGVTNATGVCNPSGAGNWTTQGISFAYSGTYTVTFSYSCGPCGTITCSQVITISDCTPASAVSINVPSVVVISGSSTLTNVASLQGLGSGYSVAWSITPTNNVSPSSGVGTLAQAYFSISYTTQYSITFTATKPGCPTITKSATFLVAGCSTPPPLFNISGPVTGITNTYYTFNSNVSAVTYFWTVTGPGGYSFGSGSSSSTASIKFIGTGTYSIHLKACNGVSTCCSEDYHTITIN